MKPAAARTIDIVTPEGLTIRFEVASAAHRILALIVDLALIALVFAGTVAVALLAFAATGFSIAGRIAMLYVLLGMFVLRNGYFLFFELRWAGSTPGKRRAGTRVIGRYGGPLTGEAVLARNLTRDIELFLPLTMLLGGDTLLKGAPHWGVVAGSAWVFVFGFLPLFNRDRLRCGDMVGGTVVVLAPRVVLLEDIGGVDDERLAATGHSPLATTAAMFGGPPAPRRMPTPLETPSTDGAVAEVGDAFTPEQLSYYGIRELQTLEDVLRRDTDRPDDEVVAAIAERVWRRLAWTGSRRDPRRFLHAFYRAQRAHLEQRMLFGQRKETKG